MHKITEREKLMYDAMCAIATANVPLIYEGAMITKLILHENNFDIFTRETKDIDACWAGEAPPTMEKMTASLNDALSHLGLTAVIKRDYGEKTSAGFKIVDDKGEIKMSMDIDMRIAVDKRKYRYGDVTFEGATSDNVICDKISAVSSNMIFRRSKDLIDLYALANCVKVKSENIRNIWKKENRTIGVFEAFKTRQDELRHAYEKLLRIDAKPDFDTIYNFLTRFLTPFIEQTEIARTWDSNKGSWSKDIVNENEMSGKKFVEKPSIQAAINEGKKSQERSKNSPTCKKRTGIDR